MEGRDVTGRTSLERCPMVSRWCSLEEVCMVLGRFDPLSWEVGRLFGRLLWQLEKHEKPAATSRAPCCRFSYFAMLLVMLYETGPLCKLSRVGRNCWPSLVEGEAREVTKKYEFHIVSFAFELLVFGMNRSGFASVHSYFYQNKDQSTNRTYFSCLSNRNQFSHNLQFYWTIALLQANYLCFRKARDSKDFAKTPRIFISLLFGFSLSFLILQRYKRNFATSKVGWAAVESLGMASKCFMSFSTQCAWDSEETATG